MALHTDYVLRTGAFEPARAQTVPGSQTDGMTVEQVRVVARRRFDTLMAGESDERLVSGSDDFTLFLWRPNGDKKPIARMTGHMQLVNQVRDVNRVECIGYV
jgi:ribosome assembly protein 4